MPKSERKETNSRQTYPNNWTPDGLSKGPQTGAVRPTPDAHNEQRERQPQQKD